MTIRRLLWPKSLAGKAGVIALILATILVILWLVALQYSSQRLADAWKLSDEFGLPNEFEELMGPRLPPERNACVPLDSAASIARTFMIAERAKRKTQDDDHPTTRRSLPPWRRCSPIRNSSRRSPRRTD
jgi:hypothetical protein